MWSLNRKFPEADRHVNIACRKSTVNELDDDTGQGLGEVNQLLTHYLAQPVAPPPTFDKAAMRAFILNAPAPEPLAPWYTTFFAPGRIATAGLIAALLYIGLVFVPVATQSRPGVEATVYAKGENATTLPAVQKWLESENRDFQKQKDLHVIVVPNEAAHAAGTPEAATQELHKFITIRPENNSRADIDQEIRRLHETFGGDVELVPQYRDVEVRERLNALQYFSEKFGPAFMSGRKTDGSIALSNLSEGETLIDMETLLNMEDEYLQMLMEKELRKSQTQESVPATTSTGRQAY